MLIDKRTTFARELAVPGSAGTAKFGEAIPLDVRADQGEGYPLYLFISEFAAGAGGTSVSFQLVTADDEALTTNVEILLTTPVVLTAAMTAGAVLFSGPIPKAFAREWLGLRAVVAGTFSAGSINAMLVQDPPAWRAYANNNQ